MTRKGEGEDAPKVKIKELPRSEAELEAELTEEEAEAVAGGATATTLDSSKVVDVSDPALQRRNLREIGAPHGSIHWHTPRPPVQNAEQE